MTQSLFAAVLLSVVASLPAPQAAKPNFTGKWTLDLAKSDFGQYPPPDSISHVVDHKEPNIKITTTTQTKEFGESTNEQNLTTDGKENPNKMRVMGAEQDVKSTARWDGEKLSTSTAFDAQGTRIEINDSWSISEDGKFLTVVRVAKTPQGEFSFKTVYNKQ